MVRSWLLIIFLSSFSFDFSNEFRFQRTIIAVGTPYYEMLLSLGYCKETVLYSENAIYKTSRLHRILNIYYKSDRQNVLVSMVEIDLVINDTDCMAYSRAGVGYEDFTASLFLPTHLDLLVYTVTIYTCSYRISNWGDDSASPKSLPLEDVKVAPGSEDGDDYGRGVIYFDV